MSSRRTHQAVFYPGPRAASRYRRLLGLDAALGLLAGAAALLLLPGLAVAAVIALTLIGLALLSQVIGRLRSGAQRDST